MSPGRAHPPLSLIDMGIFLCGGAEAPAGSSVQERARGDTLETPQPLDGRGYTGAVSQSLKPGVPWGIWESVGQCVGVGTEEKWTQGGPQKRLMLEMHM